VNLCIPVPNSSLLVIFRRVVRRKIIPLIEQWQRICILAERIIKRREAAAVRIPTALRPNFLPAHFALPPFSLPTLPPFSSSPSTNTTISATETNTDPIPTSPVPLTPSLLSILSSNFSFVYFDGQADLSRLTNVLKALLEVNDPCWRGQGCELCEGVRSGLGHVAMHTQRHSDLVEQRVRKVDHCERYDGSHLTLRRTLYYPIPSKH
jgi:sorting nexin-8